MIVQDFDAATIYKGSTGIRVRYKTVHFDESNSPNLVARRNDYEEHYYHSYYGSGIFLLGARLTSLDPSIISNMTCIATGSCPVRAVSDIETTTNNVEVLRQTYSIGYNYISGYLGDDINTSLSDLIDGKTLAGNGMLYSSVTHTTDEFIYDTNCWVYALNLTCVSPSNSRSDNQRSGTVITRRHVVNARHFPLEVGDTVYFNTLDNETVSRTITGRALGGDDAVSNDVAVYTLDSDLPSSIVHCQVLGDSVTNRLSLVPGLVGFTVDQDRKCHIFNIRDIDNTLNFTAPLGVLRGFYELFVAGDSGSPIFVVVGDKLVLVSTANSMFFGPSYINRTDYLNQLIADADADAGVSTGYTVTPIDLSSYPSF
jgi:hypothetical protein